MTSSALDRSILDRLGTALGDKTGAFCGRLITAYLNQAHVLVREIEAAHVNEDLAALTFTAHTLKGSSGTVGGLRLAELCAELERWVGSPLNAGSLVNAIRLEAEALDKDLAAYS